MNNWSNKENKCGKCCLNCSEWDESTHHAFGCTCNESCTSPEQDNNPNVPRKCGECKMKLIK